MKNILISAFVLAASSTAFAGEFYGDDTLGWISGYAGHQEGYLVMDRLTAGDGIASEFYGDTTLAALGSGESAMAVSVRPSPGSSMSVSVLDHLFPGGHIGG
jgi:hypothetical protein